jgi:DNA-binding CsgD family transcriptional regulator
VAVSSATIDCFLSESEWLSIVEGLRLSKREVQIVLSLIRDSKEQVIADELGISPHTVHTYVERLYRKLSVRSRCQLTMKLFETFVLLKRNDAAEYLISSKKAPIVDGATAIVGSSAANVTTITPVADLAPVRLNSSIVPH